MGNDEIALQLTLKALEEITSRANFKTEGLVDPLRVAGFFNDVYFNLINKEVTLQAKKK